MKKYTSIFTAHSLNLTSNGGGFIAILPLKSKINAGVLLQKTNKNKLPVTIFAFSEKITLCVNKIALYNITQTINNNIIHRNL